MGIYNKHLYIPPPILFMPPKLGPSTPIPQIKYRVYTFIIFCLWLKNDIAQYNKTATTGHSIREAEGYQVAWSKVLSQQVIFKGLLKYVAERKRNALVILMIS